MNKLQRIEEMEKQLAALRAEVEQEAKPEQWEPRGGDWYYSSFGAKHHETTQGCRDFGIERQTKEQAEADYKLSRAYNRLLAYKAEFEPDFVPVWDDGCWNKFFVYYLQGEWCVSSARNIRMLGVVYFSKEVAEELARRLNSGEVVF